MTQVEHNNLQYITNSIDNLKHYADTRGFNIKFMYNTEGFIFFIYKVRLFGLMNKCLKEITDDWDDFYNVWDEVKKYVMTQYWIEH